VSSSFPAGWTKVSGGTYDRLILAGGANVEVLGDVTATDLQTTGANGPAGALRFDGALTAQNTSFTFSGTGSATPVTVTGALSLPNATTLTVSSATVSFAQPIRSSLPAVQTLNVSSGTLSLSETAAVSFATVNLTTGTLTHAAQGTTGKVWLELNVSGTVTVDANSSINVNGKGYLGAPISGVSTPGRTAGNVLGPSGNAAGSYGGFGAVNGGVAMPVYGLATDPAELGSGGADWQSSAPGGNGGGLVRIQAGTLNLSGSILANGQDASGYGGSGGGIKLQVGTLNLSTGAQIAANGSTSSGFGVNGGGGGGRVAVYYTQNIGAALTSSNVKTRGATTGTGAGTFFLKANAQTFGDLIVDNGSTTTTSAALFTPLPATGTGSITFDNLFVTGGAKLSTPDSLTVLGTFTVDSISRLQAANLTRP
jgi:hypothetical protein